ncbi:MAG: caspase family protein [Pseudomonadales bacterium]
MTFSYTAGGRAPALFSVDSRTVRQGSERESGPTFGSLQEVLGSAFQSADWDSLATAPLNYAFNEADGITLANADSGFGGPVTINDHPIALDDGERANAGTLTPTLDSGIIGTSVGLRRVGRNGTLQWRKQTPSSVLQVNATPDGKLIVAHIADGTVRWYRAADGRELLALFPHADRKRWIAWTPSGYYAASAGADSLAGWQVDHGSSQAPDFYPLARFRNTYYRPDVMVRILDTHDEALALRQSGISPAPAGSPASRPPPVVEIVAPRDGSIIANQEVVLHYRLRSTDGSASARVQVLIDGRPMGKQRGLQRLTDATGEQTVTVTVPPRDVAIALVGVDDNGTGEAASIHLRWQPPAADAGSRQPSGRGRLNLLAVGVSDYLRQQLALRYPAKDASDVRATFSTDSGGTYASVQTRLLTNREATRDAILDGLQWLQQNTARGDVAAIFLAGHGVNSDTGAYYFLPTDFDPDAFKRTGLPYTEVKDTITSVQGRALLFVDTCHAGNVMGNQGDVDEIASDLASAENGVVVFAASTGKQVALENPSWKNGAFSLALVEGLSGKADYTRDGAISVSELETWLSDRVQSLTGGAQTPTSAKPFTVPNFVISRINTD